MKAKFIGMTRPGNWVEWNVEIVSFDGDYVEFKPKGMAFVMKAKKSNIIIEK